MRLNWALVSSFLFVSEVLAYGLGVWAGGVVERYKGTITLATGMFTVPEPLGAPPSGFVIGVGLDGITCETANLAAGVNVMMTDNGVIITPWGQLSPGIIRNPDPPANLIVSIGDKLKVTVKAVSPTNAFFWIENLNTGQSWSDALTSPPDSPLCQQNAFWVVGVIPDGKTPLANFGTITFSNILMKAPGNFVFARNPVVINIEQNNQAVTSVRVHSTTDIAVTYG